MAKQVTIDPEYVKNGIVVIENNRICLTKLGRQYGVALCYYAKYAKYVKSENGSIPENTLLKAIYDNVKRCKIPENILEPNITGDIDLSAVGEAWFKKYILSHKFDQWVYFVVDTANKVIEEMQKTCPFDFEYINRGLITIRDDSIVITTMGIGYGIAALDLITIVNKNLPAPLEVYQNIEPCEVPEPEEAFVVTNNDFLITNRGTKWILEYIMTHEFNPTIYEKLQDSVKGMTKKA